MSHPGAACYSRQRGHSHLKRFWLLLAGLAALNLAFALALIVWLPSTAAAGSQASLLAGPQLPPMVTISRNRNPFESRVRSIVEAEMRNVGFTRPAPADPSVRREFGFDREGALGGGSRRFQESEVRAMLTPFGVFRAGLAGLLMAGVTLASLIAAGAVALYLAPERIRRVRDTISLSRRRSLRLEAVGLLAYLLALALLFLLVALVTGIVLAFLVAVLLAAASFVALVAVALALGRWLRMRLAPAARSPIADLLLGLMALFPLGLVPWVGWVFLLVVAALGFGALLATKFGSEEGWSLDPLVAGQPFDA